MTPMQEDRQHEIIDCIFGPWQHKQFGSGSWNKLKFRFSSAQCIPFGSSELLVIQRSRTILH